MFTLTTSSLFVNSRYYNSSILCFVVIATIDSFYSIYFQTENNMPKELSEDLRWRVVYLYADGCSIIDIANTLYMSKSSVNRIINMYEKWACVTNPFKGVFGRKKLFNRNDMYILRSLIKDKVNWYLDELTYEMENLTGKRASISTLWRSLCYLGITRKKVLKN